MALERVGCDRAGVFDFSISSGLRGEDACHVAVSDRPSHCSKDNPFPRNLHMSLGYID